MDTPQEETAPVFDSGSSVDEPSPVAEMIRSSRKSLFLWSLVVLLIALLIGVAFYKRQFIEQRFFGKNQVAPPRKGSVYQQKRHSLSTAMPGETVAVKTARKMVKKNNSAKSKDRGTRAQQHHFAYLPTQGKFIEI